MDQTVLADEQIDSQGRSWRSGAVVEKRFLTQWYLRSTNYTQVCDSVYDLVYALVYDLVYASVYDPVCDSINHCI